MLINLIYDHFNSGVELNSENVADFNKVGGDVSSKYVSVF